MNDITTITLPNGLALAVERMPGVKSAAISILLPAGGAFDPADRLGRAAMWSELVMRGAGDLSSRQQADAFDRAGVSRTASCGPITFRIAGVFVGRSLPIALPLLLDMVRRPRMSPDAIDPARDLALQALASLHDDPHERAVLLARERHLPDPLNRSGLGDEPGLRAISRDDLLDGWARCARPRGSVVAVAGDVSRESVLASLEPLITDWTGSNPEPAPGAAPVRGYSHEQDDTSQVQILVVSDAPPEHHPDSILEKLRAAVLSGGMSGRLFTEVREKRGLCYSVSASYQGDRAFGLFSAYVGTTPERAQQSLDVLLAELDRPGTPAGRVTQDEFDRARIGMKSALVFSGESTAARAAALASDMRRIGRPRALDELADAIDAVTLDRLNDYLARRDPGRRTILTLGPRALVAPV